MTLEWEEISTFVLGPGRWIASVLSLIALALWVFSATSNWSKFGPRAQRVNLAVASLLTFLVIGFVEAWFTDGDPVFSIVGVSCSLVALTGALIYPDRPALVRPPPQLPRVTTMPPQRRRHGLRPTASRPRA